MANGGSGEYKKVTHDDIEKVKELVERCILKYMTKKEVIDFIHQQHNIEPCFTRIVWKRLEEQNKAFFRNYYLRLAVKDQITRFNHAMEMHNAAMKKLNSNEAAAFAPMQPVQIDLQPNAGMIEQEMNNGINPTDNGSGELQGSSSSVSSGVGSNSPETPK